MARPVSLTRRRMLEGMSATTLAAITGAAPFLARVPSALAQTKAPTRFLLLTVPNSWGRSDLWDLGLPSGAPLPARLAPRTFAYAPTTKYLLQPLEPYVSHLTLVGGLEGWYGGKVGPHGCAKIFLTGTGVQQYGSDPWEFHALGPSVDQFIAQRLKVDPIGYGGMRFAAANEPAGSMSPSVIARRFFGGAAAGPAPAGGLPVLAESLAPVYADIKRERAAMPVEDRMLLDRYLGELEAFDQRQRERQAQGTGKSCGAAGPAVDVVRSGPGAVRRGLERAVAGWKELQLVTDLVVQAFACNLTRVAAIGVNGEDEQGYYHLPAESRFGDSYSERFRQQTGLVPIGEHDMDHNPSKWVSIRVDTDLFYMRWFAGVLKQLKERIDVDGRPLLDNTAIMLTRDQGIANHKQFPLLHIFAGGAGGSMERGRYFMHRGVSGGDWINRAHVSCCHLMGLRDVQTFGIAEKSAGGPLPVVRA